MRRSIVAIVSGGISSLLGLTVLIGWYTRQDTLVHVLPDSAPMQTNAALGFLLCGLGLLSVSLGRDRLGAVFGTVAGLIGLLTLFENATGWNLGIDNLLMRQAADTENSQPGRMAPNTALCFYLIGSALFIVGLRRKARQEDGEHPNVDSKSGSVGVALVGVLGSLVIALGLVALIGYAGNIKTAYGWGNLSAMAVHTAAGFLVLGVGLLRYAWNEDSKRTGQYPGWLPLPVGIAGLTVTICLWQALSAYQAQQISEQTDLYGAAVKEKLDAEFDSRIKLLTRMARRLEIRDSTPKEEWDDDAFNSLQDQVQPVMESIQWVDPSFDIRWVVSLDGISGKNQGYIENDDQRRRSQLASARDLNVITASQSVELEQGNGILVYVPINRKDGFGGFILGVFSIETLMDTVLRDFDKGFNVTLSEKTDQDYPQLIFQRPLVAMAPNDSEVVTKTAYLPGGVSWDLRFWPNSKYIVTHKSWIAESVLFVGLLLSGLLALAVNLALMSVAKSEVIETARQELEVRVKDRTEKLQQANVDLVRSNKELDNFAYVASHDLKAPLRAIHNLSEWIEEDLGTALEGDAQENMQLLRARVNRLERLLDDLLAYSRAGRTELDVAETSLHDLVQDIDQLLVPPEGFSITAKTEMGNFKTSVVPLHQVLRNLISNAVKHHDNPSEGSVEVGMREVGELYEFTVTDNGPGIGTDFHEKIFGMFQTLRPRDEVEGSGMGLAIVKKLVEWKGGGNQRLVGWQSRNDFHVYLEYGIAKSR